MTNPIRPVWDEDLEGDLWKRPKDHDKKHELPE